MNSSLIFTETANRKGKRDGDEFRLQANGLENHWGSEPIGERVRTIRLVKASRAAKKQAVLSVLNEYDNVNRIAFFCHGTPKGISLGFTVANIPAHQKESALGLQLRTYENWPELSRQLAGQTWYISDCIRASRGEAISGGGCPGDCIGHRLGTGNAMSKTAKTRRLYWSSTRDRKCNVEDRKEKIVTKREGFAMLLCRELDDLGIHAVITAHLTAGHTTYNPYKVRIERKGDYITRRRLCPNKPRDEWKKWITRLNTDLTFRYDVMLNKWRK
jgi:hypothetical protein